jgi:predicted O-methyltransferase YrrM
MDEWRRLGDHEGMNQDQWDVVDGYLCDVLLGRDEALEGALARSAAAGLPEIQVAPNQGKLLMLLAMMVGAKKVLELGTLGGYSTIWLARGVRGVAAGGSGGRVISLELDEKHAAVARENIAAAGMADVVEVRVGKAIELLPRIEEEGEGAFDVVFIDADKASMPEYFAWAVKLSRPGTVIVGDNVVRDGAVVDGESKDASVRGVRRCLEMIASEPRVSATAMQTVGVKGWDGFFVAVVLATK